MPENTVKNIKNKCESYHVPFRIFSTRAELGQSLGKSERKHWSYRLWVCD